jgi:hypothetical protein
VRLTHFLANVLEKIGDYPGFFVLDAFGCSFTALFRTLGSAVFGLNFIVSVAQVARPKTMVVCVECAVVRRRSYAWSRRQWSFVAVSTQNIPIRGEGQNLNFMEWFGLLWRFVLLDFLV